MFKKFVCFCMVLCMAFTLMVPAQAKTKVNPISSDTVITEDNLPEVLEYLGLNPNKFIKTDVIGESARTVGELKNAIDQFNKLQKEIKFERYNKLPDKVSNITEANNISTNIITPNANTGTVMLCNTLDVGGSYTLTYEVAAQYAYGYWTEVTYATVSVDTNLLVYTYKISNKVLRPSCTPSMVTLESTVVVDIYYGVGGLGLVYLGSQTTSGWDYWDTSYITGY